jgi:hypothetical protein
MEHQAIFDALNPLSAKEAKEAISAGKIYIGAYDSPAHRYAMSLIESKEVAERNARDSEMLSIARKSLIINAPKKRWYEKPFGIVVLGTLASLLAAVLCYFYLRH